MLEHFHNGAIGMRRVVVGLCLVGGSFLAIAGVKDDIQADMLAERWEQAETGLRATLEKHPNNPLAHYWRAQVQEKLGHLQLAQQELDDAKRIDPSGAFAGDPEKLARLEAQLAQSTRTALLAAQGEPVPTTAGVQGDGVAKNAIETFADSLVSTLLIAAIVLAVLLTIVALMRRGRASTSTSLPAERDRAKAALEDALRDLQDAMAWSDGNPALAPETRLTNYDRVKPLISEVKVNLAELASLEQFEGCGTLVRRAHDVAANVRGEETPSAQRVREREEAQARWATATSRQPGTRVPPSPGLTGAGVVGDALVIGGAAAWMSSSAANLAHASSRSDDQPRRSDTCSPNRSSPGRTPSYVDVGGISAAGTDTQWSSAGATDSSSSATDASFD